MEHDSHGLEVIDYLRDDPLTVARKSVYNAAPVIIELLASRTPYNEIALRLGINPFHFRRFLHATEEGQAFEAFVRESFERERQTLTAQAALSRAASTADASTKLIALAAEAAARQVDTLSPKTLAEADRIFAETVDPTAFKQPAAPTGAQTTVSVSLFQATQAHAQARKQAPIVIDADPTNGLV
jgi:hypothetical protein